MKRISIFSGLRALSGRNKPLILIARGARYLTSRGTERGITTFATGTGWPQRLNAKIAVTAHDHLFGKLRDALAGPG